jgi:hypothetical protein
MSVVLSVEYAQVTLGTGVTSNTYTPTLYTTSLDNCVPFISVRVVTAADNPKRVRSYVCDPSFSGGDLVITRDIAEGTTSVIAECYIVEYDPARAQVIQGTWQIPDGYANQIFSFPDSASVTVSSSFIYFGCYQDNGTITYLSPFAIRGKINSTNQAFFGRTGTSGTADGHYYVVESTAGDFTVSTTDITIADLSSSDTGPVSVDSSSTFLLGSWDDGNAGSASSNADQTIDAKLNTAGDTVTLTRTGTNGAITYHGQLVEMADDTSVQRDTQSMGAGDQQDDVALGASVDDTKSMAIRSGNMGYYTSGNLSGTASSDVPDGWISMRVLSGGDDVRIEKSNSGNEAADISWQVIEWDVGGTPPAAPRRIFVS